MLKKLLDKHFSYLGVSEKDNFFLAPTDIDFCNRSHSNHANLINNLISNFTSPKIKNIIGCSTSVGVALLLSLGYRVDEMQHKFKNISFYTFTKNQYPSLPPIPSQLKCLNEEHFFVWAKQQVADKLGHPLATFADLHKQTQASWLLKNIHLIWISLITGKLVFLNHKNTPDMPIAIAARLCMSFSTKFSIVKIEELSTNKKYAYVDGGITLQHMW